MDNETELRRQLQLALLRQGFTQEYARIAAETWMITPDSIATMEKMREDAKQFPERQIVPLGTVDMADVKSQREEAVSGKEEDKYYKNQVRLEAYMMELFSPHEVQLATLQCLLDVLTGSAELNAERLAAMTDIIKTVQVLRSITEHQMKQKEGV